MGRPNIQIVDRTQLVVTEEDYFIAKSDKSTKQTTKKAHNFAKSIRKNGTLPKRHTKQWIDKQRLTSLFGPSLRYRVKYGGMDTERGFGVGEVHSLASE